MDAKHQFKYTYNEGCEDFSPIDITFEVPGDATLNQMLYNFQSYLKAAGFVFTGELEIVDHTFDVMDELDGTLYEFDEEEPKGGCMADWDKDDPHISIDSLLKKGCGCPTGHKGEEGPVGVKEWNEGLARLEKELKEERAIRGKASLRADELKEMNERWNKLSNDEKVNCLNEALKKSGVKLEPEDNCWNS